MLKHQAQEIIGQNDGFIKADLEKMGVSKFTLIMNYEISKL